MKLFACIAIALLFAPILLSQQGYIPFATEFDGSSDHYLRGAGLTGAADSKSGILSFWFRMDGSDGSSQMLLISSTTDIFVQRITSNVWRVLMRDAVNTLVLDLNTTAAYIASPSWKHLVASWDVAATVSHLYVNDVSDKNEITNDDLEIDYTQPDWAIGARTTGANPFDGAVSELYFAPGEFLDLSIEANRRLFITSDLKPVDLGPGCYKPTGTVAIICMQTQFNGFGQNSGSGGDFTPQDPTTRTAGPVPILQLPGRAAHAQARGRGGRGRSR